MSRPPDPGGGFFGGGDGQEFVPSPTIFVTLSSANESGMETDASSSTRPTKRARHHKKNCKKCNKKKAKYCNGDNNNACCCSESEMEVVDHPPLAEKSTDGSSSHIPSQPKPTSIPSQPKPTPISRTTYEHTDMSPYVVHVVRETTSANDGTILHPITFGKFLQKNNFQHIINGSVKRIGRNRMTLSFSNHIDANHFMSHNSLIEHKMKGFIPSFNITRLGLVRGIPADWSEEEVLENINIPIGCGKILKFRRLNYRVVINGSPVWKPSQSVVLTFDGQVLPKRIFMCYNALPVETYIYPTIQCFSCCRFGHTKIQCRSKPRCFKCGQAHDGATCKVEEDSATCCLCSGMHFATDKACPELSRQKAIKKTMAESCISYSEASKIHPPVNKSYADILNGRTVHSVHKQAHSSNIPENPSTPSPLSYKKTVLLKPRINKPASSHPYDRRAHNLLTNNYDMPAPTNGCAIRPLQDLNKPNPCTILEIISNLISSLSVSNIINPDHAASIINTLSSSISIHNSSQNKQNSSVELSQCAQ